VYNAFTEEALVLALLTRMGKLEDQRYAAISPEDVSAEALATLVRERAVLVHVDAGSRTIEEPASPISMVKLAIYTVDFASTPPETRIYYPVYSWRYRGEKRSSNLLYALGDYRVRQALSYLIEIAGLYAAMKRYGGGSL